MSLNIWSRLHGTRTSTICLWCSWSTIANYCSIISGYVHSMEPESSNAFENILMRFFILIFRAFTSKFREKLAIQDWRSSFVCFIVNVEHYLRWSYCVCFVDVIYLLTGSPLNLFHVSRFVYNCTTYVILVNFIVCFFFILAYFSMTGRFFRVLVSFINEF